ncbi:methyltransferase domain-containing protein [[Actinomadura] parvosata]|uniref:methyltransferase domain-containing protein n=1 Tax=[Actinomadura] parvosata TaxID=1955412 RepID=UPI00406C48D1
METIVNTAQAQAWNGYEGEHWAAHQDRYDAVNSGFNQPVLDAAQLGDHDRVLDIGCGNGQLTRLAARAARHAVGVDLSEPMLARARSTATAEGLRNITFERGDVQVHPFPPGSFDAAVSRFAVMFFNDPVAAFANVARALRPGGRLAFVSMKDLHGTDLGTVMAALAPHLPGRQPPATPNLAPDQPSPALDRTSPAPDQPSPASDQPSPAPDRSGPLSLSDPDHIRDVLTRAGFRNITVTHVEAMANWGENASAAAAFFSDWGPVRHNLAGADPAPARAALEAAFRPFETGSAVRLRSTAWLVRADGL